MSGSRNIKDATTNIFLKNPTSEASWTYQIDDEHLEIFLPLNCFFPVTRQALSI